MMGAGVMDSELSHGRLLAGASILAAVLCVAPALAQPAMRTAPVRSGPATVEVPASPTAAPGTERPAPMATGDRAAAPAERGALSVTVDRAKIIRLPEKTQTVVIGNPAIADLAIQKNGIVVVTGKSYGATNVIALDATGQVLAESTVTVNAATESIVTVQRGEARKSYSCNPSCLPSVQLGDVNDYFSEQKGQAEARNQFATSR